MEDGKLKVPTGLYRKLFFPHDPWIGVPKLLEIEFVHAGNRFFLIVPENVAFTLPFPHVVSKERVN